MGAAAHHKPWNSWAAYADGVEAALGGEMVRQGDRARDGLEERLSDYFERVNFGAYVQLLQQPRKILWLNFLGGLGRGVGIGIGFTVFAALIFIVLQKLSLLNLPIIGTYIADIVRIVQAQLHTPTI